MRVQFWVDRAHPLVRCCWTLAPQGASKQAKHSPLRQLLQVTRPRRRCRRLRTRWWRPPGLDCGVDGGRGWVGRWAGGSVGV